ncbi:MAG TPA: HEAT repeat domain-containing protein, partial [bacterium]|nr:HEAT repeat domain-containing protein [bacterium]
MSRFPKAFWLVALAVLCSCATPRSLRMETVPSELEAAFQQLPNYRFGEPNAFVVQISNAVNTSQQSPAQRHWLEGKLLDVVKSSGTRDARDFACRQLSLIGTKTSVSTLVSLLTDEELSDSARYALERIPGSAVEKSLVKSLAKVNSHTRQGILNSLGSRQSARSVSAIRRALSDEDKDVVAAALYALANIGSPKSALALIGFRAQGFADMPYVYGDACLICAERLVDKGYYTGALQIYGMLISKHKSNRLMPEEIRSAALKGVYATGGMSYNANMSGALFGMLHDIERLGPVADLIRESPDLFPAKDLAEALDVCEPSAQLILLGILSDRGDSSVSDEVLQAVESPDASVRRAALEALTVCGDIHSLDTLIQIAATGDRQEQESARTTLSRLQGEGINERLLAQIPDISPEYQVEVFRALVSRVASETRPELLKMAQSQNATIQRESFRAIASLGMAEDVTPTLQALLEAQDESARKEAERTVALLCEKQPDQTGRTQIILNALADVDDVTNTCSLLRIMGRLGGSQALESFRQAMESEDADIRETAIRSLSEWPDATALDDLMQRVQSLDEGLHKTLAMRGAARLIGLAQDKTSQERVALCTQLMNLAGNAGEKKLVLSVLGKVPTAESLEMVTASLGDEELFSEASAALFDLSNPLKETNFKELESALDRIISATTTDDNTREKAEEILVGLDRYSGHILIWEVAGPYTQEGSKGEDLLDVVFAPEQAAGDVEWKAIGKQ